MWDLSACCLEKCSCARGRRRKNRSFVQNQQVTLVPVQMFACCIPLPSPGELWDTARLGNLWIVTPVVNMMLGLKWLQGVTGQPASAACLDSCPGGKSPSLWAALQSGCSISAVVLFKVLLFHFTLSGGSFCQPHWELFHSLIHLRITKCCMIIQFKCFLCLVSPFHLPIFHALSLVTFCPSSNFHPQSHPHQISILWWYSKSVNIFWAHCLPDLNSLCSSEIASFTRALGLP